MLRSASVTWILFLLITVPAPAQNIELRKQGEEGLKRAVTFLRHELSIEGGYLWRYSEDLKSREGEAKATATQAWVQSPGTPAVGSAYLHAFEHTRDPFYRDAAHDAARALVKGQLRSGGWDYRIEFEPKLRGTYAYRKGGSDMGRNVTTLDDNTTQGAIRFLMHVDVTLGMKDAEIHEAVQYALDSLLKVQYPNGAWPQRFDSVPDSRQYPIKPASFPNQWSREYPGKDYRSYYTFNDNALSDVIDTLFEASRIYGTDKYRAAAIKAGGFILLAQLPEPQPGWAQQYDAAMHPAWARKFEPPAVTGGESQGVMRMLLRLHRETGEERFLEPIPRALAYYRKSVLPDGRLARFYEMKTNRPLYFTKDYKLTYDDSDIPTHYGFKTGNNLDSIAREYDLAKSQQANPRKLESQKVNRPGEQEVRAVLATLDAKGRWVEPGRLRYHGADDPTTRIIDMRTAIRNIDILSRFLRTSESK